MRSPSYNSFEMFASLPPNCDGTPAVIVRTQSSTTLGANRSRRHTSYRPQPRRRRRPSYIETKQKNQHRFTSSLVYFEDERRATSSRCCGPCSILLSFLASISFRNLYIKKKKSLSVCLFQVIIVSVIEITFSQRKEEYTSTGSL